MSNNARRPYIPFCTFGDSVVTCSKYLNSAAAAVEACFEVRNICSAMAKIYEFLKRYTGAIKETIDKAMEALLKVLNILQAVWCMNFKTNNS